MRAAEKLYTRHYRFYDLVFMQLLHYDRGLKAFFEQNRYLKNNLRVLDAGCGSGAATRALHELAAQDGYSGISYYGFDITQAMLNQFKQWIDRDKVTHATTCRADVLSMNNVPDTWTEFDLIVSSAMLEYLPKSKLTEALQNLRQRLAANGTLVVFITKQNTMNRWLIEKWWKANAYIKSELETTFSSAGFQNITLTALAGKYRYINKWD